MPRSCLYLVLTALPALLAAATGPQSIPLPADTSLSDATDINARGDIVGWRFHSAQPCPPDTACSGEESFIVPHGGTAELFTFPGSTATFAQGINARRDVVGKILRRGDARIPPRPRRHVHHDRFPR